MGTYFCKDTCCDGKWDSSLCRCKGVGCEDSGSEGPPTNGPLTNGPPTETTCILFDPVLGCLDTQNWGTKAEVSMFVMLLAVGIDLFFS